MFYFYSSPKHSEKSYHEVKESNTLKDSTIAKRHITNKLSEPEYDVVGISPKSSDDIKLTSNPAYDVGTTIKMEDNPAYSLSGNKVMESDYM